MILSFGKYKNHDIEEVPTDYLRWLVRADIDELSDSEIDEIESELTYRDDHSAHFFS